MRIERDVPITVDDGLVLRADVFRPDSQEPAPVIMTMGPYGKGVEYKTGYKPQWNWLMGAHPNVFENSSASYLTWETVDPERWTAWGYVMVRVDSRGSGRSPGILQIFSPRETKDYYHAIEWAGTQSWSNGHVGLNGISYYAINQWLVAALQPPHLKAIIPWEGAADMYRDIVRHGGICSNGFFAAWYPRQVLSNQHGNSKGYTDPWLNELATGPETLTEEELAKNRIDVMPEVIKRPLDSQWYRDRSPDWSKVTVPFLSAANWAGFGLHPRGNFEAFTQAASSQKWLECHPGRHEEWFYLKDPLAMQKRFLDHFLKGIDNGWDAEPRVIMHMRRPFTDEVETRKENDWPLASTKWTPIYLGGDNKGLAWTSTDNKGSVTFEAAGEPITFMSTPLERETEITGPLMAHLYISSSTADADLFVTFQAFSPDGKEVEFQGTVDPHTPLAQGWLRASHRKVDQNRSTPGRPYHTHDEHQPLSPGQVYKVDIEIWPTGIIIPAGFQLALQISGHDFERPTPDGANEAWVAKGSGPWLHTHPEDRPKEVFGGQTTIHTGSEHPSYLLLPIIP